MGTLLLVRHGQASWGADDYDVLSPLGWEQARMLGAALAARGGEPARIVHGRLRRQAETAEAMAAAAGWSTEPVVEAGWDEFDHVGVLRDHMPTSIGEPDPQQLQQWLHIALDRWTSGEHDAEYAESFQDFAMRTRLALEASAEQTGRGETTVIVTSGGPIAWLSTALVALWRPEVPAADFAGAWARLNTVVVNSSVTKVTTGARGVRLVSFNEHNHLEGDVTYR